MSEVISFRLNKENPREAQAFEILDKWRSMGYSLRYVFTEALLELDNPGADSEMYQDGQDLGSVLRQIGSLLKLLEEMNSDSIKKQPSGLGQSTLNDGFLASIQQAIKPGIRVK